MIPISAAYAGLQVIYVIMMYISVYPVVITMKNSNVYEERSLGIYADDPQPDADPEDSGTYSALGTALRRTLSFQSVGVNATPDKEDTVSFISQQIRSQLAHDLWWLALAVFAITVIETRHFLENPTTFNVFNVLFEVVSAYGTVGISVGLPTQKYSFSGAWNTGSKIILCLLMLREDIVACRLLWTEPSDSLARSWSQMKRRIIRFGWEGHSSMMPKGKHC